MVGDFRAKHIKGLANKLADGISRWKHDEIAANLRSYRPDICWQEQCTWDRKRWTSLPRCWHARSSDDQLRTRLRRSYASAFRSLCAFRRLIGCKMYFCGRTRRPNRNCVGV